VRRENEHVAAVAVKPNAQNVMLDEPTFKTRTAASIAEIGSLQTTPLIRIVGNVVSVG
jgi:hypothetical protein